MGGLIPLCTEPSKFVTHWGRIEQGRNTFVQISVLLCTCNELQPENRNWDSHYFHYFSSLKYFRLEFFFQQNFQQNVMVFLFPISYKLQTNLQKQHDFGRNCMCYVQPKDELLCRLNAKFHKPDVQFCVCGITELR